MRKEKSGKKEKKRKEGKNIEQESKNGELRNEYLLHKSHINIPCSEIDLA
jgi:hypothetical protein